MKVSPFEFNVPQAAVDDLMDRLRRTRWPSVVEEAEWQAGTSPRYMGDLVRYWYSVFAWRSVENRLNSLPNFRAEVDGLGMHFVHVAGKGPDPTPIILCHGWPGSVIEMLDLAELLADPCSHGADQEHSFDVVIPSLPGFGFSDAPPPHFDRHHVADLWVKLMKGLGYSRFGAHAYDIAASTMSLAAMRHPESFIGYHTTEPANPAPYLGEKARPLTEVEQAFVALGDRWDTEEGAYMKIAATKPQTIAYGLNDSPAGLAAWIVEKWHGWTDPSTDLEEWFSKEQILANVAFYWFTGSVNSANRYYHMARRTPWAPARTAKIVVPTGVALTATQPTERVPREYAERIYSNILHWEQLPRGGHFVTMQEPALLASSIRQFFQLVKN